MEFAGRPLAVVRQRRLRGGNDGTNLRIGFLAPEDPNYRGQVQAAQKAAPSLGIELVVSEIHDGNYENAFATMVAKRVEGICIAASTFFVRDRFQIVEYRHPAVCAAARG